MNATERKKIERVRQLCDELLGDTQAKIPIPKEKTQKEIIVGEFRNAFDKWYEKEFSIKFVWQKKDDVVVAKIVSALKVVTLENTDGVKVTGAYVLRLWEHLLSKLQEADQWVYDNASPSVINSKMNQIVKKLISSKDAKTKEHETSIRERLSGKKIQDNGVQGDS